MLILAADTSTPYLSIALYKNARLVAEISEYAERKHAENILLYLDQILQETDTSLLDIDLLAVAHGPGSFTGVRVGVSAWKGLAAGANIPIIGISTLDALARRADLASGTVCTLLDAKMNEVYAAVYRYQRGERQTLYDHTVAPIDSILRHCPEDTAFLGDGAALYREQIASAFPKAKLFPKAFDFPGASSVALEALALTESRTQPPESNVTPVYLRQSQAEVNRDQQRETVPVS